MATASKKSTKTSIKDTTSIEAKSIISTTPTTKLESKEAKKLQLFGKNHHHHKPGEEINHHKTAEQLEEETNEQIPVSKIGWEPIGIHKRLFIEASGANQFSQYFGPQENIFQICAYDGSTNSENRLFIGVETLNEFDDPIPKKCCKTFNQKDHNFDCTVIGPDGCEIMNILKTTPNEIFMTRGKEHVGLITQEDGHGENETPFNYTIHDTIGPLINARRGIGPTDWTIAVCGGNGRDIGKICNKWLDLPDGLDDLNSDSLGVDFYENIKQEYKGFMVVFLFVIYFRFSRSCHIRGIDYSTRI